MDINEYTNYKSYQVSEIQVSFHPKDIYEQTHIEHIVLSMFNIYDDEIEFEDGNVIFLLIGPPIQNAKNLNVFTNFIQVIELSRTFVNTDFIYSFMVQTCDGIVISFVDVHVKNGVVINKKCISCFVDDTC